MCACVCVCLSVWMCVCQAGFPWGVTHRETLCSTGLTVWRTRARRWSAGTHWPMSCLGPHCRNELIFTHLPSWQQRDEVWSQAERPSNACSEDPCMTMKDFLTLCQRWDHFSRQHSQTGHIQGSQLVLNPLLADLLPARSWWEDFPPHTLWDLCSGLKSAQQIKAEQMKMESWFFFHASRSHYFWPLFIADVTISTTRTHTSPSQ